ncbi:MAG: hypothetical protein PWR10_1077 [Halanaerobiales bacterium]|nr:hypothetical protein [Halanaerobiales bacterium]
MEKEEKILLCGREFTQKELEEIKETIKLFTNLSRRELALTICEHLNWFTPAGKYKYKSAINLLEKLQELGEVNLPEKRKVKKHKRRKVKITPRTDARPEIKGTVSDFEPIELELVKNKRQRDLWNEYIERYHILGYKVPFGAHQRYFIISRSRGEKELLGCLLFSAAAWALEERDKWIGWEESDRSKYLNGIVNNTRFLIFPWVKVKNLASKALSLAAKRIRADWKERYNYEPVLMETFVDEEKYQGTCYRAANWIYLGKTKGRGRQDRYTEYLSTPKLIFVYPLVKEFRSYLRGERSDWELH